MIAVDISNSKKQLKILAVIGLGILALFAAAFVWLYYYVGVLGHGGGEVVLVLSPYWIYPYLIVSSVYVGFFAAWFARSRWKHTWLWGIAGFALSLLFTLRFPGLFSHVLPYRGPEIFAGPAIFAFVAPILAEVFILMILSIHKMETV